MTDLATARPALFSRPLPILIFIVIAVILDQIVKIAVDHYLPLQEAVPVIPMLALYALTIWASRSRCYQAWMAGSSSACA